MAEGGLDGFSGYAQAFAESYIAKGYTVVRDGCTLLLYAPGTGMTRPGTVIRLPPALPALSEREQDARHCMGIMLRGLTRGCRALGWDLLMLAAGLAITGRTVPWTATVCIAVSMLAIMCVQNGEGSR